MVTISFGRDRNFHYNGFSCSGHADFAEHGSDIVCAGISALTQTVILALENLLQLKPEITSNQQSGDLSCTWTNSSDTIERSDFIVEALKLGLTEIQNLYPEFLFLEEAEVLKNDHV